MLLGSRIRGQGATMILFFTLLFSIQSQAQSHAFSASRIEATDARIASLKIPAGFKIEAFARDLKDARMLLAGPDGEVFLTRPRQGDVLRLVNENGKAAVSTALKLADVHGIAIDGKNIYVASVTDVYVGKLAGGKITGLKKIISGLPSKRHHEKRTLLVGPDKKLYISIGSDCNACVETDDRTATIMRSDLDGKNPRIFAKGLRNTIGFEANPRTGKIWGMDHGVDGLGDDQPGEELNLIEDGGDYGWPYVTSAGVNPLMEKRPVSDQELLKRTRMPVLTYTAHSAPIGFAFVRGSMFPKDYAEDAFVTFHGSWNRAPSSGYEVVRVHFEKGKPVRFEPFISGFLTSDGKTQFGRPTGIAFLNDGSMVFADDENGVIYRVTTRSP